ncbi:SDR family NAD(P)-dependent oxidoreductase [Kineosporia babensis]|uniref:SDR family oxidoreductase n=1 Tax=Kineosporia babensis TaxID=499548 RepID=A0A9X1NJP9_9ACTN|nr:SDR family oxidoreductase [Kineosporia babensis]MCD5315044.1 SDR family oxidoreductase [Kineosporia babensis]
MGQLDGKTAVVTGASDGIGLGAAQRLAAEGAHVFITGRREAELEAAAQAIGSATAVPGDIAEPADLDRLYEAVRARGQGLDVVFANAATAGFARIDEMDMELLDTIYRVNIRGTVLTVQKALPLLNQGASIILNASTRADDGWEGFGAYGASKAALRLFGRTWANELKDRGIRVNTISPGAIATPAVAKMVGQDNAEAVEATFRAKVPLQRHGTIEEVAAAVAFLASPQSSFVLGANLYVDGGENGIRV